MQTGCGIALFMTWYGSASRAHGWRGVRCFGPDVQWCDGVDYGFDESRAASFYSSIRRYYPLLADGALVPGFTGVRPKTAPATSPAPDFQIDGPRQHGVPGLVNLFGIESPGLTSVLAIADHVRTLAGELAPMETR